MPKCDLRIELDEPDRVYRGGETVSGVLTVRVDQNVKCDGLSIRTIWETHGKGNVARGVTDETVAFRGDWSAGTTEQYRFELECGNWPPTYYGVHLNIDHYVEAQVDIPWAFDPKHKLPFRLLPKPDGSLETETPKPVEFHGVGGKIIGAIILVVLGAVGIMFLFHPCVWVLALGGVAWWFWTKYLPKKKLGAVQFNILTPHVAAGHNVQAEIVIQPGSAVPINQVKWKVLGEEVVVRGHGTNRKTYRHTIVEHTQTDAENTKLIAHEPNRFLLDFPIPSDAPMSLDLDDNDFKWSVQGYVDIPRWPDWKQTETIQVLPSGATPPAADEVADAERTASRETQAAPERELARVSFQSTVDMIFKVRTDGEQLERVLQAVRGKDMEVSLKVAHPVSLGRIDPSIGHPDGKVFEGETVDEHLSLMIYIPRERKEEFDDLTHRVWTGRAQITGYDDNIGSLQIKVAK